MKDFRGVMLVAASILATCGKSPKSNVSKLDYSVAPKPYAGLLRKVHNPFIKICMATDSQTALHKADVIHAVDEWTGALVPFATEPVTRAVQFLPANDASCDAVVRVGNYNPAHTYMGNRPEVNIAYSGWHGSRTIVLHEFGHAFGLYDTYAGGGGSCQPSQPNSVMCRASYDNLKQDDIDGVRIAYRNARSRNFAADDDRIQVIVE